MAIGAADDAGARCAFSASGAQVDLWAPGCPVDASAIDGSAAWAAGTSESTAFVAAILTQMRQACPDLGVDDAETLLTSHDRRGSAGPGLDVMAAYASGGLEGLLDTGHRLAPPPSSAQQVPVPPQAASAEDEPGQVPVSAPAQSVPIARSGTPSPRLTRRLPKPMTARVHLRHSTLDVALRGRPSGVAVVVAVYARRGTRSLPRLARIVRHGTDRLRVRVKGAISEVAITYRDPTGRRTSSAALILHPREEP